MRVGPEPNPQPWPLTNSDRTASPVERGHQVGEPELLRTPIMNKVCTCQMIVRSCQSRKAHQAAALAPLLAHLIESAKSQGFQRYFHHATHNLLICKAPPGVTMQGPSECNYTVVD